MKYFKCGKCQTPFKVDETALKSPVVSVICKTCTTKNTLRFGGFLLVQNKTETKQIPLKIGVFLLGRKNINNIENFVYVSDEFVSKNHVLISVVEKNSKVSISLKDINSTNGVYDFNKQKIRSGEIYNLNKDNYFIIGLTKLSLKFY